MSEEKNLSSYNNSELISIICELEEIKALRVTVRRSIWSGLVVGVTTTLGGFLLGPFGLFLGGSVGGAAAYAVNFGGFRSVPDILMNDLTEDQARRLANSIRNLFVTKKIMTVATLFMKITSEDGFKETLVSVIKMFLRELNYSL